MQHYTNMSKSYSQTVKNSQINNSTGPISGTSARPASPGSTTAPDSRAGSPNINRPSPGTSTAMPAGSGRTTTPGTTTPRTTPAVTPGTTPGTPPVSTPRTTPGTPPTGVPRRNVSTPEAPVLFGTTPEENTTMTPTTPGAPMGGTMPGTMPGTRPVTPGAPMNRMPMNRMPMKGAPMTPQRPPMGPGPIMTPAAPVGMPQIAPGNAPQPQLVPCPYFQSGSGMRSNTPVGVPLYPLYGYDNSEEADRDMEYMKQLYPSSAKMIQREINKECDQLEYDGSFMFDEYPDKISLDRIIDRVYDKVKDMEEEPQVEMNSVNFFPRNRRSNPLRDIVTLVLLGELFDRRRRYRRRRRWF